ncbi:MAG: hypothetical protein QXG39_08445, partial [Candidatus Aenigmatarchaeota archaeon]
ITTKIPRAKGVGMRFIEFPPLIRPTSYFNVYLGNDYLSIFSTTTIIIVVYKSISRLLYVDQNNSLPKSSKLKT